MLSAARVFCSKEFVQRSEWRWWSALLAGTLVYVIATITSVGVALILIMGRMSRSELASGAVPDIDSAMAVILLTSQLLVIGALVILAGWRKSDWLSNLYLLPVSLRRTWVIAFIAMIAVLWGAAAVWDHVYPEAVRADGQWGSELLLAPGTRTVAFLMVVIGAPVSEELLFRGFVLPPLAKTRLGFWGAAAVTTLTWMATHFYSWQGSLEIMVLGFALSYLLWRTGSILPSIALHGLWNGVYAALALY